MHPLANAQTLRVNSNTETALTLTWDDGDPEVAQGVSFILGTLPAEGALSLSRGDAAITLAQLPLNLSIRHFHDPVGLLFVLIVWLADCEFRLKHISVKDVTNIRPLYA